MAFSIVTGLWAKPTSDLYVAWRRGINGINGINGETEEFAGFKELQNHFDARAYFAHPYCAWERATNENTNGLLRQFLPKKTDFRSLTQAQLDIIAHRLNNRPRKRLDYRTPCEAFQKAIVALRV